MEKKPKNKIKFKRSRLILTAVYAFVSASLYCVVPMVPPVHRYVRQLFIMLGTMVLILTMVSFFKLFTREIRQELYRRISEAMFNAGEKWRKFKATVRKKLGLPEKTVLGGRDERHIVFEGDDVRAARRKRPHRLKYSDMTNNRERIRFLWAKYVIDTMKKETQPSVSNTPAEIKDLLGTGPDDEELFMLYYDARYTPDDRDIPAKAVVRQAEFVGTRGKI